MKTFRLKIEYMDKDNVGDATISQSVTFLIRAETPETAEKRADQLFRWIQDCRGPSNFKGLKEVKR